MMLLSSGSPRSISDALASDDGQLDSYFLANRTLVLSRTSNLLIASSFGANSILYAAWLGYMMGFWALLIHAAWCLSFIFLAHFSKTIFRYTSLNDFLGCKFGQATRTVASMCSTVGILYFAGWEIAIARSGIESLLLSAGISAKVGLPIILSLVLLIFLLYVGVGGRRASGVTDTVLNFVKYSLLMAVVSLLVTRVVVAPATDVRVIFPNFSGAMATIGVFGFITNFVFNLSWQFVDNSSWQSISAGDKNKQSSAKISLLVSSVGVFLAYTLGTALGAFLRQMPNLNSDNILGGIASVEGFGTTVLVCVAVLLLISTVSLIDGVGLSVAQTILVDLRIGTKLSYSNNFLFARIFAVAIGVFSAWGVQALLNLIGANIFDFVYAFIVIQLSLIGPVLIGLVFKNRSARYMWVAILLGIMAGVFSSIYGNLFGLPWLVETAGIIAIITSVLSAFVVLCFFGRKAEQA